MDLKAYESANAVHEGAVIDPFTAGRYRQFAKRLPTSAVCVLDVGASTGRGGVAYLEARPDSRLLALDCVAERLAALPDGVYAERLHASSTDIPLGVAEVDAVVAGEFVEHLAAEDVAASLDEFARVIRFGGALAVTTPNPGYLRLRLTGGSVLGGAHLSAFTPRELVALVERHGFTGARVYGSGRVSGLLGEHMPLPFYGSYLVVAQRGGGGARG